MIPFQPKWRKARRQYHCMSRAGRVRCENLIAKGSLHFSLNVHSNGTWMSLHLCATCGKIAEAMKVLEQ